MPTLRVLLVLVTLAARSAVAADVTIAAGRLRAEITLDPWHLAFADAERGVVLSEGDAAATGPSGSLGFRTADGWAHARRAVSQRSREHGVEAVLETTDPGARRMVVRVAPARSGVIVVEARLEDGPDSA